MAKIEFNISFNNEGFVLTITGFNSSIQTAIYELISLFKKVTTEDKLNQLFIQKDYFRKQFENFYLEDSQNQANSYMEFLLKDPSTTPHIKLKVLEKIDLPFLQNYVSKYLKETRFEWIIQGNLLKQQAIDIAESCHKLIQEQVLPIDRTPIYRIANITPRENYVFRVESKDYQNVNSCLMSYFQFGHLSPLDRVKLSIVKRIFSEKFFDDLRTKQALGYVVQMYTTKLRKVSGLYFAILSSVKCPEYVWQKVNDFIANGEKVLSDMNDEELSTYVESVRTTIKEKDLKLSYEASRNYFEIKHRDFLFNIKEIQLDLIKAITKNDIQIFYRHFMIENFKRLDVEVLCANHVKENEDLFKENKEYSEKNKFKRILVESINDFKKKVTLYEDFMY